MTSKLIILRAAIAMSLIAMLTGCNTLLSSLAPPSAIEDVWPILTQKYSSDEGGEPSLKLMAQFHVKVRDSVDVDKIQVLYTDYSDKLLNYVVYDRTKEIGSKSKYNGYYQSRAMVNSDKGIWRNTFEVVVTDKEGNVTREWHRFRNFNGGQFDPAVDFLYVPGAFSGDTTGGLALLTPPEVKSFRKSGGLYDVYYRVADSRINHLTLNVEEGSTYGLSFHVKSFDNTGADAKLTLGIHTEEGHGTLAGKDVQSIRFWMSDVERRADGKTFYYHVVSTAGTPLSK